MNCEVTEVTGSVVLEEKRGSDAVHITRGDGFIDLETPESLWIGNAKRTWYRGELETASVWSLVTRAFDMYKDRQFLGHRTLLADSKTWSADYEWSTYGEVQREVDCLGSAISGLGVAQHEHAAILSVNSPEWTISEFAMARMGIVSVPLYTTFGVPAMRFILQQAEIKVAVCSAVLFGDILSAAADGSTSLKTVVLTRGPEETPRPPTEEQLKLAETLGIRVLSWAEAIQIGSESPRAPAPVAPDDVFSIIYTSGTTGDPKGVITTNNAAVISFNALSCKDGWEILPDVNVFLSYLPLSHVFERIFIYKMTLEGSMVGYSTGDMSKLLEDLGALKPTFLIGVPRVWKKIHDTVMGKVAESFFLRTLFTRGLAAKAAEEKTGAKPWVDWDKWVFSKFRAKIGGRCKIIISGSAPLSGDLAAWFRRVFGVRVYQGYGLTELFTPVNINSKPYLGAGIMDIGHPSIACSGYRLVDCPELGYRTADSNGEIWLRGPTVFRGYHRDTERTSEVLDNYGWFRTGDIASLRPDGSLFIIDRVKSIFKTAQAEYVPAEYLETVFSESPLVSQVWVHGESVDSFIIAVVVPNIPTLAAAIGASRPSSTAEKEALCKRREAVARIMEELTNIAHCHHLPHFMIVRAISLCPSAFTVEEGLVTPTFKLRRGNLKKKFASLVEDMRKEVFAEQQ